MQGDDMILDAMRKSAFAVCLVLVACPGDVAPQDPTSTAKSIDGLWTGAWGGGQRDGVIFQPVIAELLVKGDYVELCGFRNLNRLTGTVRVDARAKRLHITPATSPGGPPKPRAIEFTYEFNADELTL